MTAIFPPSREPIVAEDGSTISLPTNHPITKHLYKIGQVHPQTEANWFMQHGRYLAGFGGLNETQQAHDDKDSYLRSLEVMDDVFGSGIFDAYGQSPTVHANMGVFGDHPSLPGFVDREVLYEVNKNIADLPSGADVVTVSPGGLTFMERQRYPVPFDRSGPTPCPPELRPPPPTTVQQVYAALTKAPPNRDQELFQALGPAERTIPLYQHVEGPYPKAQTVGRIRRGPPQPRTSVPAAMTVPAREPGAWRELAPNVPSINVGSRDISQMAVPRRRVPAPSLGQACSSGQIFNADTGQCEPEKKTSWGAYLFAGLLVGAGAAIFVKAGKSGKRRK